MYRTGRQTHRGVEVLQYFDDGTPQEKVVVIAYAVTNVDAEAICQAMRDRARR